jgi:hypothetical protein
MIIDIQAGKTEFKSLWRSVCHKFPNILLADSAEWTNLAKVDAPIIVCRMSEVRFGPIRKTMHLVSCFDKFTMGDLNQLLI